MPGALPLQYRALCAPQACATCTEPGTAVCGHEQEVSACVAEEEEYGYVVSLGIPGAKGFLPKNDMAPGMRHCDLRRARGRGDDDPGHHLQAPPATATCNHHLSPLFWCLNSPVLLSL